MKIEILMPDTLTVFEFIRCERPEGVSIRSESFSTYSAGGPGWTKVIIDFGVQVGSGVITAIILAAFSKYKKKHPDYKTRINHRETRLEHTEIFRIIEEERTTQDADEHDDASH